MKMKRIIGCVSILFFIYCFVGCSSSVNSDKGVNYLDSYIGHWSDINIGQNHIDVVISTSSIEGAVSWNSGISMTTYTTTEFNGNNPQADGINGLSVVINYDDYHNCKLTGHFRNADKSTLELQFHNDDESTFKPHIFTLYKHFY